MSNLTWNRGQLVVQLALSSGLALLFLAILAWGLGGASPVRADPGDLYVDGASGQDAPTCGTTIAPCQSISYTLHSRASDGDTILIATGTYSENLIISGITVTLRGGYTVDGTLWLPGGGETIVDGNAAGRVFLIRDNNSVLENLTISGGEPPGGECWGGGVWVGSGNVTIRSSMVTDNGGKCGSGGIEVNDDFGPAHLILDSSTVSQNAGSGLHAWGGGASVEVRGGTFTGNAGEHGAGISIEEEASAAIIATHIYSNTASSEGGGIRIQDSRSVTISGTQIYANTAVGGEGGGLLANESIISLVKSWVVGNAALSNEGGGVAVGQDGSAYVENCVIAGNVGANGGGLWLIHPGGRFQIVNTHIVGNDTPGEGGGIASAHSARVEVTNTLIISNTGNTGIADRDGSGSVFVLNYCDTYGNGPDGTFGTVITRTSCLGLVPGDGVDPQMSGGSLPGGVGPAFADEWMAYDYHLQEESPAVDAGTNGGAPDTDFEGDPRPLDGDGDGTATTDMGADEFRLMYHIFLPLTLRGFEP